MESNHKGFKAFRVDGEKVMEILQDMASIAKPSGAFGEPTTAGEYTVIPAAEVSTSLGAGFGYGSCSPHGSHHNQDTNPCGGGGGGGGGISMARPVASIAIGPHGVSVNPIIDFTKIGLALITAFGSVLLIMGKIAKTVK
ncbi:MAG: spore germination protein GerW family protein [Fibrobacterota bacterium]